MQLVRLHWIGTISGRAPPPDALPCTAPACKSGQGGWVVREEERGEMICCGQGREQKVRGREANNQQCTRKVHTKQPPANAHASAMHPHIPATVAAESVQQESAARGEKSPGCQTAQEEEREGGRHTAHACGSRDEHVGDAGVS